MTALALLLLSPDAMAYSSGKTGSSTSGCGGCHGSSPDSTTSATLSTAKMVVSPGDTIDIEMLLSTTTSSLDGGGLNVSVTSGTLQAGSNTQTTSGEITHSRIESLSGGAVTFDFTWLAPSQEGDVTFYAAGNAVNGNGATSGDGWSTSSMTVTVSDGCEDLDGDSVTDCAGDCDDDDSSIYPGADEVCDGVDQDCDDIIDNGAIDAIELFEDLDGDGYGNSDFPVLACEGVGFAAVDGDCDDNDADSFPGAEEIANDGIDQDCDGVDLTDSGTPTDTGDTGGDPSTGNDTGDDGGGNGNGNGDGNGDDDDKNDATCSVVSGAFGMGAVWLGLVGILRRRES